MALSWVRKIALEKYRQSLEEIFLAISAVGLYSSIQFSGWEKRCKQINETGTLQRHSLIDFVDPWTKYCYRVFQLWKFAFVIYPHRLSHSVLKKHTTAFPQQILSKSTVTKKLRESVKVGKNLKWQVYEWQSWLGFHVRSLCQAHTIPRRYHTKQARNTNRLNGKIERKKQFTPVHQSALLELKKILRQKTVVVKRSSKIKIKKHSTFSLTRIYYN